MGVAVGGKPWPGQDGIRRRSAVAESERLAVDDCRSRGLTCPRLW
jgi:hypothetical protein